MKSTKTCTHCGDSKALSDFSPQPASRDGRSSWCRECSNSATSDNLRHRRQVRSPEDYERCRDRAIARLARNTTEMDGCLVWQGWTHDGYGSMRSGPFQFRTHRLAYEVANDVRLDPSQCVCHSCDVKWPLGDIGYRRCINPGHMFIGTRADNQRDMADKRRSAHHDRSGGRRGRLPDGPTEASLRGIRRPRLRGQGNGMSKLTVESVIAIRLAYEEGEIMQHIAARFNIGVPTVSRIVNRRRWAHV